MLEHEGYYIYDSCDGYFLAFQVRSCYQFKYSTGWVITTINHCIRPKRHSQHIRDHADFRISNHIFENLKQVSISDYYKFCFNKIDSLHEKMDELYDLPEYQQEGYNFVDYEGYAGMRIKFGTEAMRYKFFIDKEGDERFPKFIHKSLPEKE